MTKLGSIENPDLSALLRAWREEIFFSLNCHQVGTIVSFDAATQAARVSLTVLRVVGDARVAYPLLVDVPVFVPAGGTASLRMPVKAGDTCLVLFNDRDMDTWFATGATDVPNSTRAHSLADGLALVGFRSRANPIAGYSTSEAGLYNGTGKVTVDNDGNINLFSSGAAEIQLEDKIRMIAGLESFASVLDAFLDALAAWVNTGGSTPNPATVAALATVKTRLQSIFH